MIVCTVCERQINLCCQMCGSPQPICRAYRLNMHWSKLVLLHADEMATLATVTPHLLTVALFPSLNTSSKVALTVRISDKYLGEHATKST
jgi:hypothetical protein